jgi:hypothetical protein
MGLPLVKNVPDPQVPNFALTSKPSSLNLKPKLPLEPLISFLSIEANKRTERHHEVLIRL